MEAYYLSGSILSTLYALTLILENLDVSKTLFL